MTLAYLDDDASFRRLLDEANAANTSFYPIDPRGLTVFDESIAKPVTGRAAGRVDVDRAAEHRRGQTACPRRVAAHTGRSDGRHRDRRPRTISRAALKRVVDDLSSYYLIGYYSSGKLDGKFHQMSVRVKRPGVRVRARRGYLAEPRNQRRRRRGRRPDRRAAEEGAGAMAARAVAAAVAPLSGYARDVPLRLQMAAGWKPGDAATAALWVVGELGRGRDDRRQLETTGSTPR